MDEILGEFIAETLETLEALSNEVVAWEADPTDQSRLDAFFRFFHTVKGSCGFLNLPRFERLAHGAEDVLAAVRRGERIADPATVTAVLAIMDRIGALARDLGDEDETVEADDDALLNALSMPVGAIETQHQPDVPGGETERSGSTGLASPGRTRAPRTIRLPLALIDKLMNGISDMVLARNDLARKMRERGVEPDVEGSFERLSANVADLRDMISKTRMQRVDRLYASVPRMVRDLARDLGKTVSLDLDGGDVEMDREMIEMIGDPLTHIVRNALDHGIEFPADRIAAGKAETGRLSIVARQSGNQIVIEVSDDGRGIDRAALVDRAVAAGILSTANAAVMSDSEKVALIFHPGLSTAAQITQISGRGVGMDVVRANIEQIGGVIDIASTPGQGATVTMRVPLTLTIIPGLITRCGPLSFAMPRGNVMELLHENSAMVSIEEIGGARIATIRGIRHSVIELEDTLGLERGRGHCGPRTLMVIRSAAGQPYVLGVEAVDSSEELVIRPVSPVVAAVGVFVGMTLPDNGQPMLLLDAAGLARVARLPLLENERKTGVPELEADQPAESVQALLYRDRDGARRLMPLAVVDRIEGIDAMRIAMSNGRAFARIEERLLPALNIRNVETGNLQALRLHDGRDQLCFVIEEVIDIIDVPARLDVSIAAGRIAGLVMVGETQMEMIDPFALFAEVAAWQTPTPKRSGAIRCLIADVDDPWMRNILAPLLVQAGHEVSFGPIGDVAPDVVLCGEDRQLAVEGVPVLALRDVPEALADVRASSIYRYDRETLMAAISGIAPRAA